MGGIINYTPNITYHLPLTYGVSVSIVKIGSVLSIISFSIVLDQLFGLLKSIDISSDITILVFWKNPNNIYDPFRSIFSLIGIQ